MEAPSTIPALSDTHGLRTSPLLGQYAYRLGVAAAGLSLLGFSLLLLPPGAGQILPGIFCAAVVAGQLLLPVGLLGGKLYLAQSIVLYCGLAYGPGAGLAALVGVQLGWVLRLLLARGDSQAAPSSPGQITSEAALSAGLLILPLVVACAPLAWRQDALALSSSELTLSLLLFTGTHTALYLGDCRVSRTAMRPTAYLTERRDLALLLLLELLPLPLIWAAQMISPTVQPGILIFLGAANLLCAAILRELNQLHTGLVRSDEWLSTLSHVSQALNASQGLDTLLGAIYQQVCQHFGADSFYLALYNPHEEKLWYPLAVKRGRRVAWSPRPLADRLTDRVIRNRQPVLIACQVHQELVRRGLPTGKDTPAAWMGVPVVLSGETLGCLAVCSHTPGQVFSQADLDLLSTLSGPVSLAVGNSLLQEKARSRAAQLESVGQITMLTAGSQNLAAVLAQVCRSAAQSSGVRGSAIFLADLDGGCLRLAHTHGLSPEFAGRNQVFSLVDGSRTRCLRTGRPVLIQDICLAGLEASFQEALETEGIHACADFPLPTPEGPAGYLSVYYTRSHAFAGQEVELLQTFAGQAALAVSSARMLSRTDLALARRAHQHTILENVGRALAAEIRSERLFEMILDYAMEFTNSHWGMIRLYDHERGILPVKAVRGYPTGVEGNGHGTQPVNQGICGRAVRTRQAINTPDTASDPDYLDLTGGRAHSQLSLPLIHRDRVLGVLVLESAERNAYDANDQAFIGQLANGAAVALLNAELYQEIEHSLVDQSHARARLAAVLDSTDVGVLMIEAGGRISLANRSIHLLTGMDWDHYLGARLHELPVDTLERVGLTTLEAAGLAHELSAEKKPALPRLVFPLECSPARRVLERSALPVHGPQQRMLGWMIVLRDRTEEQELAQARELLTDTLIHDLRSPLSAVVGALDILEEMISSCEPIDPYTSARALALGRHGTDRVLGLVDSLLDITRMQSGRIELAQELVDLGGLAAGLLGDYARQAEEFGVKLSGQTAPVWAVGDAGKITRALVNLLDNALKFTPPEGSVTITVEEAGGQAVVRVKDTGPGIPADYREKIFERFCQVPGQSGRRRGNGLGLTFCKLAVEAHGGKIWVEPNGSAGSVFTLTLPLEDGRPTSSVLPVSSQ